MAPGRAGPLGAHWDGLGTSFTLYSRHATAVELCLFDDPVGRPRESVPLVQRTGHMWHVRVPGVGPGALYAYRVDGPWAPAEGHLFNPAKLLQDPWARALCGEVVWHDALLGYRGGPDAAQRDDRDSAPFVPRSVVVDACFPWEGDAPPRTPLEETVVYECHVKGMTKLHPEVPERLRGTYLGLASDPVVEHLRSLGVTAVELLPVQHGLTERRLAVAGLHNYWGYNTLAYFAPDSRFATADRGEQVAEFKGMVKALHREGIEVILDVVYNHTAEGDARGPTLSLRGVDHRAYYALDDTDPRRMLDTSGCGNALAVGTPPGLWLLMDSLRYWVSEMHVDGFRFDLAPALARRGGRLDDLTTLFDVIRQDPVLADAKLIAEPWDLGGDGFRLGGFPEGYAEWNARYRDSVRRFWRGDGGQLGEIASRIAGSQDVFGGRTSPLASLNYVVSHDGFTLADLVSYEHKHNEANLEDGRDGNDANWSANWGVEGPTDSEAVLSLRDRIARNLVATLAFSRGIPMLAHGDELLRSQGGNNNAYCHDDETTWMSWAHDPRRRAFLEFVREVFALRAIHPTLRAPDFFDGEAADPGGPDVRWLRPDGSEMGPEDWGDPRRRALGILLPGEGSSGTDERGRRTDCDTLMIGLNAGARATLFTLPEVEVGNAWHLRLSTAGTGAHRRLRGRAVRVPPRSLCLLVLEALR